eukprot:COSAG02_NODE_441_length_22281_cov_6.119556_29_plen_51_part_00
MLVVSCGDMVGDTDIGAKADSEGAFVAYNSHEWIGMGRVALRLGVWTGQV